MMHVYYTRINVDQNAVPPTLGPRARDSREIKLATFNGAGTTFVL
jgi:hypothetical protein